VVVLKLCGKLSCKDNPLTKSLTACPEAIWVNWTGGPDRGLSLHCEINDLTLYTGIVSEYGVTEYDVATLKKLLDKMDDNIVFSFSDLKIHFNK